MKVALVLGAGGSLGWAYHLGVLEGVREVLARDPMTVDRLVGTSAGGAIGATVMAGATTEEVLASIVAPMTDQQRAEMGQAAGDLRRSPLRWLRPQAPRLLGRGGVVGLVGLLPAGVFPTWPLRRFPTGDGGPWPPNFWVPSVRLDDGETVVFGRDRTDVDPADALEATSAIPTLFRPKELDGHRYIDGAVASATHADLLVDDRPDVVLVASPMTRPGRGLVRLRARRQLRGEVGRLRRAGSTVVVVEPTAEIVEVADGYPRHRPEVGPAIVDVARAQTIEALGPMV